MGSWAGSWAWRQVPQGRLRHERRWLLSVDERLSCAVGVACLTRYQELIAAKYAETYLQELTRDLRHALSQMNSGSDLTSAATIKELAPAIERISDAARVAVASAYAKAASTHNIALEIQHMERALNSSLSHNLRTSLAFGRSLK